MGTHGSWVGGSGAVGLQPAVRKEVTLVLITVYMVSVLVFDSDTKCVSCNQTYWVSPTTRSWRRLLVLDRI